MKIRLILIILPLLFFFIPLKAEILNPVKWSYSVEKAGNGIINLHFKATIDPNWHLYSQFIPEGGPVATTFQFTQTPDFELVGTPSELSKSEIIFDKSFSLKLRLFTKEARFVQKIRVKSSMAFHVTGTINFMSCDDHQCLPPRDDEFNFLIPATAASANVIKPATADTPVASTTQSQQIIPISVSRHDALPKPDSISKNSAKAGAGSLTKISSSLWTIFLLAFLAGIAGLSTPCVYPMIPMTVSFFIRGESTKIAGIIKALFFGLSIIFIYTMIGLIVAITGSGANVANTISSHWIPNLIFFLLFFTFAASFYGAFEIVLPSSLTNKIDKQADKGGYMGVFFMALTLVVVSFSCTVPFVSGILIEASNGEFARPVMGMFGYSLAFAIPFVFFAIFPTMMKNLAKSGSWLNSVKVVMAFILLAFSLKFLLAIDTTHHFNILTRDLFLSVWIVIFSLLGMYLAGKLKFAHDSDLPYISVSRLVLIIATFSFVFYMIPGLFGAPLKLLSSVLPPAGKEQFSISNPVGQQSLVSNLCETPRYENFLHLPFGLKGYFDYDQGMACAKKLNKPVFLDLKGHTCSNCKVMEAEVFSDPGIIQTFSSDFVIIALYTDDNYNLPEREWVKSTKDGKLKKTMGAKNLDLEISMFDTNTLPLYVILKPSGEVIAKREFNLDKAEFQKFLAKAKE